MRDRLGRLHTDPFPASVLQDQQSFLLPHPEIPFSPPTAGKNPLWHVGLLNGFSLEKLLALLGPVQLMSRGLAANSTSDSQSELTFLP